MDNKLAPFPDAERQVRALADLYCANSSKTLVGAEAHEDNFKQLAGEDDILHFATHGFLNNAVLIYSRLLTSQTDLASDEDGLLEAWEWFPLKLRARIALLSGCETGRGRIGAGEGSVGIELGAVQRRLPGGDGITVNSASATELMLGFHRRLLACADPSVPLREAGLELSKD